MLVDKRDGKTEHKILQELLESKTCKDNEFETELLHEIEKSRLNFGCDGWCTFCSECEGFHAYHVQHSGHEPFCDVFS